MVPDLNLNVKVQDAVQNEEFIQLFGFKHLIFATSKKTQKKKSFLSLVSILQFNEIKNFRWRLIQITFGTRLLW
jgi:hypothetical protein